MTKVDIKVDTDQTAEMDTVSHHIAVDLSMDKIIKVPVCSKLEETLVEKILEKHIATKVNILEEDI